MLLLEDASKEEPKPDQISMSSASDPSSVQSALVSEAEQLPSAPDIEVIISESGISATHMITEDSRELTNIRNSGCDQIIDKGMETPIVRSRSPSPKLSSRKSPKKGASDSAEGNFIFRVA